MAALGFWKRWNWIDENVLLGALPSRSDISELAHLGVGAVVNTCEEFPGYTKELARHGMTQLYLPTLDYQSPSKEAVRRGVEFIQEQVGMGRKVYVHCKAGRGRSATVALAYMMTAHRLSAQEAYDRMKAARPQINSRIQHREVIVETERTLSGAQVVEAGPAPMRAVAQSA